MITAVTWDFSAGTKSRKALGSDLWPCTWARDDNLYCAWGDGGGFDDDNIGRVSLGFARITGIPLAHGESGFYREECVGAPPYSENSATFGGKVESLVSIDGVLYAIRGFWTSENTEDPAHRSGSGPLHTLAWSSDLGKNWQTTPSAPGVYQYLSAVTRHGRSASWSTSESEARAIFRDPNNVDFPDVIYDHQLHRYLMTVGHYRTGFYSDSSIGQFGLFEGPHPWGPWSTIDYYDDWGHYGRGAAGDFLGMHMPNKWVGFDGKTRWFVFSALHNWLHATSAQN